jgi:hypothetical protein
MMNLWTIPLRIALTLFSCVGLGVLAPIVEAMVRPETLAQNKVALLVGWAAWVLAIWCWGRTFERATK